MGVREESIISRERCDRHALAQRPILPAVSEHERDEAPGPSATRGRTDRSPTTRIGRIGAVVSLLLVGCAIIAMLIQDHSQALPLGLQNQARRTWELMTGLALGTVIVVAGVLIADLLGTGRRFGVSRVARAIRGGIFAFVMVELSLAALDLSVVSRGPGAWLGGPYQEVRGAEGEWVALKKAHAGSRLGFRTVAPWPEESDALRILFLGDSYTEGSGRAPACNYPDVVANRLEVQLGHPIDVLNAGVAGHGPDDTLRVLRLLIREQVQFDAIVQQIFLENDFSDNLPGTERRVMAGIMFRTPASPFLQIFHPMNGRAAHWVLLVSRLARGVSGGGAVVHRDSGTCVLDAPPEESVPSDWTLAHMADRFATNYGPTPRIAPEVVARALEGTANEARKLGVPLIRVVFPDRILVDTGAQQRLGIRLHRSGFDPDRLARFVRKSPGILIDVRDALEAGTENFKRDTHLSDLGNVRAGEAVASELARILPAIAPEFRL